MGLAVDAPIVAMLLVVLAKSWIGAAVPVPSKSNSLPVIDPVAPSVTP